MTQAMKFGNVSVMPGETARGGIPVNPDMFPREREIPLIVSARRRRRPGALAQRGDPR